MTDTIELSHWIDGERWPGRGKGRKPEPVGHARRGGPHAPRAARPRWTRRWPAARAAFPGWADASPEVRSDVLDRAGSLMMERREPSAVCCRAKRARPWPKGIGETVRAGRILKYFAGEALRLHGQNLASIRPGVEIQTYRQPVGVYRPDHAVELPHRHPGVEDRRPALAFGNTVVMKPASHTPATAEALVAILHEAGLPKGVLNLVIGGGRRGPGHRRPPGRGRRLLHRLAGRRRGRGRRAPWRVRPGCSWRWAARTR